MASDHGNPAQLRLSFVEAGPDQALWEYAALVTSLDDEILTLCQLYRDRADCDIDQAWRLSRISGVAVGLCKRRRPAVPRGRRRSDSPQCADRLRIGLHQFSATNAGLHHAAA